MAANGPQQWRAVGASTLGASHRRQGSANEDAIRWAPADGSGSAVVLAVADGHGSARCFRSARGARLAVDSACLVGAALAGLELPERDDDSWRMLAARVAADVVDVWRAAVGADLRASPIDERETAPMAERYGAAALTSLADDPMQAYGTTLLLAVLDRKRCLYAQIGDGDILAVDDRGVVRRPVPADERLIGDRTTSLCTPDAMADFRVCIETSRPALVLLATDGYANSFSTDDEFLLVGSDYLKMIGAEGLDSVAARLEGWLAEASELGSGDDITVGMATSLGHST